MSADPRKYVQTDKAILKRVGGEPALYVRDRKAIHVLNRTAFLLYQCLEAPLSRDELVALAGETLTADRTTLEHDIDRTLDTLLAHDLVRLVE